MGPTPTGTVVTVIAATVAAPLKIDAVATSGAFAIAAIRLLVEEPDIVLQHARFFFNAISPRP